MTDVTPELPRIILASRSPRRRQLLEDVGISFEVFPATEDAEDGIKENESPEDYAKRLAFQKAENVVKRLPVGLVSPSTSSSTIVVSCDTLVFSNDEILGKPKDREDARRMLRLLRGTEHHVISGLCLWNISDNISDRKIITESDSTVLRMDAISDREIEQYLDTKQWTGKAGAFGYQDGYDWLHIIQGSESNVVGLPLELLAKLLKSFCY